jgi:hypothetical protein
MMTEQSTRYLEVSSKLRRIQMIKNFVGIGLIAAVLVVTEANAQSIFNEQFQRDIQYQIDNKQRQQQQRDIQYQIDEQQRQQRTYQMNQWMIQDKARLDAASAANRARESAPSSGYIPFP